MSKSQEHLTEPLNQTMGFYFKPEDRLYHEKTPYQDLEIFSSHEFGNILRLDGVFQTSEKDEFLYHEPLAHVPGVTIGGANRSLVIGGGDGGAAEELLKYNTVEQVVMIELDEAVCRASEKFLSSISNGAFQNPKLDLRFEDGLQYLEQQSASNLKFDQIIVDLTDPFGPSKFLYTKEFYSLVNSVLNENGALSLHIEAPLTRPETCSRIYQTLKSIFSQVATMTCYVPLYGTLMCYAMASQKANPHALTTEIVEERIKSLELSQLQYYNGKTHFGLIAEPNYLKELFSKPYPIVTKESALDLGDDYATTLKILEV